jgi:transcriptional regulator with XRE-family HTH domain
MGYVPTGAKAGRPYGVPEYKEPVRRLDRLIYVLRKLRHKNRLTQEDLASISGYATAAVYRWEQGKGKPRLDALHAWAGSLGVRLAIVDKDNNVLDDVDVSPAARRTREKIKMQEREQTQLSFEEWINTPDETTDENASEEDDD